MDCPHLAFWSYLPHPHMVLPLWPTESCPSQVPACFSHTCTVATATSNTLSYSACCHHQPPVQCSPTVGAWSLDQTSSLCSYFIWESFVTAPSLTYLTPDQMRRNLILLTHLCLENLSVYLALSRQHSKCWMTRPSLGGFWNRSGIYLSREKKGSHSSSQFPKEGNNRRLHGSKYDICKDGRYIMCALLTLMIVKNINIMIIRHVVLFAHFTNRKIKIPVTK